MTSTNTNTCLRVWANESARAKQLQASQPDIARTVYVGTGRMTASLAYELVASLAIGFLGMSALAALLAGVAWVNPDQRDASELRLIVEKHSQLSETPSVQRRSFALPSLYPPANVSEFFNGKSAVGAFGERDDSFGNCMVGVTDKPRLLLATFLQQPLGGFGAFSLQFSAQGLVAMPDFV